jgi:uncharacterized protein DUF4886
MVIFKNVLLRVVICLLSFGVSAQQPTSTKQIAKSTDSLRLFLIGNSFSQNATRYLPQLAEEAGHALFIGRAEIGGASMQRHWDAVEAAMRDTSDPKGKPYGGRSLLTLLSKGTWDVVTIQQASIISGDVDTYRPYAKKLYDFIKSVQPKARVVLHETWAYRSDDDSSGTVTGKKMARSQQEMYEQLRNAYYTIAKELKVDVIPNGDAFNIVTTNVEWGFKKDTNFNYAKPEYPALPVQANSLHIGYTWNREQKFSYDSHHASVAGCYLGGLVWYAFLFKESPAKLSFKPEGVSEEFANYLKRTAARAVNGK